MNVWHIILAAYLIVGFATAAWSLYDDMDCGYFEGRRNLQSAFAFGLFWPLALAVNTLGFIVFLIFKGVMYIRRVL
jgi:hypothetical protein